VAKTRLAEALAEGKSLMKTRKRLWLIVTTAIGFPLLLVGCLQKSTLPPTQMASATPALETTMAATVNPTPTGSINPTPTVPPLPTVVASGTLDRFGILKIFPSNDQGWEWFSQWDQGPEREYTSSQQDEYDPTLLFLGEGTYHIYGSSGPDAGLLRVNGMYPRIYVRDTPAQPTPTPGAGLRLWHNVEITFYGKTLSYDPNTPDEDWNWAGFEAVARTNHYPDSYDCGTAGYGGRMLFKGLFDFEKEISHNADSNKNTRNEPNGSKQVWQKGMPLNKWIGYKFVVRNVAGNTRVRLELYLDKTEGKNGGDWGDRPVIAFEDSAGWSSEKATKCDERLPGDVLLDPNWSVYLRTDALDRPQDLQYYKWFSVREIAPLP
jgi:hypothetical protein